MGNMLFLSFWGILFYSYSFASCSLDLSPLKDRVKNADVIFIGIVLSDSSVATAGGYDREAMVQVKKAFKGDIQDRVIIQYTLSKEGHCDGAELTSLSVGMGQEKLFYAKRVGDKFFASDEMGVEFVVFQPVKQDIAVLPAVLKEASRPWWDFFGWAN